MIQRPFAELIDALAARTPTPGGGAAAALAACMGQALFLMVVRFSRGKKANAAREGDLAAAETALAALGRRLLPMAEADCRSFDAVSAAFALPKDGEERKAAREAAVQAAMAGAMVVPEQVLGLVGEVFAAMAPVATCIGKAIVSDLASGSALLLAAAEGAFLNVRINAGSLTDRALVERTLARNGAVIAEARRAHAAIVAMVDQVLA